MKKELSSRIPHFYQLSINERIQKIQALLMLSDADSELLTNSGYFNSQELDNLSENVIGSFQLPMSIATNFVVNKREVLIPMVTEEASVVAAASFGAKLARSAGGFIASPVKSIMTGQIQILDFSKEKAKEITQYLDDNKIQLLEMANQCDPLLVKLGGGTRVLNYRKISTNKGEMIIVHLDVDVKDAMGANAINTMVESLAKKIQQDLSVNILLRIITNLSIQRIASCTATFDTELLGGPAVVENILKAHAFAVADPFRATTHNKGIMNGIVALATATGNDTRAIEAGAHAYASYSSPSGSYSPLTSYRKDEKGRLVGEIRLPLPMATIGGLTQKHPMVKLSLKILGVQSAENLSQIAAAIGLAQNLAALRALVSEGIQAGHMKLHHRKLPQKNIGK